MLPKTSDLLTEVIFYLKRMHYALVDDEKSRNQNDRAELRCKQQQATPEFLLTKKELARRLRISERKIEMDDLMPAIRWGRSVRYDWAEVLEYLKSNDERGQE